ncbi:MAG: sodium:glutamate symporter [Spirochaetaceae bacterium]|nr:MAG: sodium:glutamate symporter [Spirochaetaceae bacterium]
MNFTWSLFVDLGVISAALIAATLIRAKVRFFQRYLIPNALTAGFILLPLYNYVFPLVGITSAGLGELAYHLLSISFVAMALRKAPPREARGDSRIFATSVAVLSQYALQAALGLLLTLVFILTVMPQLYHSFGFLLPLGFVLGPGQAFAIGTGWEVSGIAGAGSVGLTFAALGFIVSCFGGVFLINYGIKRGWLEPRFVEVLKAQGIKSGVYARDAAKPVGSNLTTETEAIDSMTFNTAIVLLCYFAAYLFLQAMTGLLSLVGPLGQELAVNLWGISFIFASLIGLLFKAIFFGLKVEYVLDNPTLNRIAGLSVDVMVASAIAAISVVVVSRLIVPILVLSAVGTVVALLTVPWICSRIFGDHQFHRMLIVFGVSTGTLSTGLALLRVVDPDFETPVASDYAYASGITFVLAIPFILSINLPVRAFVTGNMVFFWIAVAVSIGYLLFVLVSYILLSRRRAFARPAAIWLGQPGAVMAPRSA